MTIASRAPLVAADTEWSPLRSVIVGRASHSCFPHAPSHMLAATMPSEHLPSFRPGNPFPTSLLEKADAELAHFVSILEANGIRVYRPQEVDWLNVGGYTAAMPRDGLLTVGNTIIEAPFSWECRHKEIELAYGDVLDQLAKDPLVRVVRAPKVEEPAAIYRLDEHHNWAINDSRPAFDAADFLRLGKVLVGQLSHVTNLKGVEYLRSVIPEGYSVELLETTDEHAMHIDATILPLRKGLLVYNPGRISEAALRQHDVFTDWQLHAYPYAPKPRDYPPRFMTSGWLLLNVLSLDETRVVVEAEDKQFAEFIKQLGMEPILCPFQHVHSIGGSFHCATVDLVRS